MRERWGKDERRKERARRSGGRVRERGKMWRRHGERRRRREYRRMWKEGETTDAMTDVIGRRRKK